MNIPIRSFGHEIFTILWLKDADRCHGAYHNPNVGANRTNISQGFVYSQCQNYRTEPGGQKYGKIPYLCPPPGSDSERSREI